MLNISALIKETQIPNSSMYVKVKINSRVERNKIAIIIINTLGAICAYLIYYYSSFVLRE